MDKRLTFTRTHSETGDRPHPDGSNAGHARFDIDLPAMAGLVLSKRRWVFGLVGAVTVLTVVLLLLTPNRYMSQAIILPSGGNTGGGLSTLKAMVGLGGGASAADENPSTLFPLILSSNLVRDAVLAREYAFSHDGQAMRLTLQEYIGIDNPDRLRVALGGMTAISSNTRTGEIVLGVETEYPELSQAIVQEYLDQLESYNLHKRKSSATENTRYLDRQVAEAKLALEDAENMLEAFRGHNAAWVESTSPEVLTQVGRLTRDVQIRSTAYLLLQEQFELAKLEAQKDLPIVSILDEPSLPTQKSGPFRAIILLTTMAVTFAIVVAGILALDILRQITRGPKGESIQALGNEFVAAFPRTSRMYGTLRRQLPREAMKADTR